MNSGHFVVLPSPTPCSCPLSQSIEKLRCPNYGKQMVEIPNSGVKEPKIMDLFSGGCQCGAIRFQVIGPLRRAGICHCCMCQEAFGSWGSALVSVSAENLTWTRGQPSVFRSSAIVARGFCATCGTPLHMREDRDGNFELSIGAFDEPSRVGSLTEQVGVEGRVPWFKDMLLLPEQTTAETRAPEDLAKLSSLQHPDHDTDHWP
jgi:hypothetical protein